MMRYWLRTIIRMLNVVEEQLGEFKLHCDDSVRIRHTNAYGHLKLAIRELNELHDHLQEEGK